MPDITLAAIFAELPVHLRDELVNSFNSIVKNYRERHWEATELNGGKFCEIVYSILKGFAEGKYPTRAKKPKNMVLACQQLENEGVRAPRSIRLQIPRMIIALYEIRNNRNVGHVGGDVDPSHMDAVCVLQMVKWIMAELVRLLHAVDVSEATTLVEGLVERDTPQIWEVNGKRRVLTTSLTMRDKTLLLLHASHGQLSEVDLVSWIEHSNPSVFRRHVLKKLHTDRFIEYSDGSVAISPLGIAYVEEQLLLASA